MTPFRGRERAGTWLRRWFVAIAAIVCLLMAIVTPPFQAADEYLHFYRAYQISEGQFVPTRQTGECSGYSNDFENVLCLGGASPRSLLTTVRGASAEDLRFDRDRKQDLASLRQLWQLQLEPDDRHFLKFNTTGLHAPIGYLPQAVGIGLGRALSFGQLPPIALMYLGRLANATVWIAAVSFAIAIAPELRLGWLAIGLLPMALFQAASLSADVATNGLACAIVAAIWRYRSRPFASLFAPGLLAIATGLLAVSKLAYTPMALLLCLVPPHSFRASVSQRYWRQVRGTWLATTAGLTVALVFGWSRVVNRIYVSLHPDLDPNAQIAGILADPLGFLGTAIATLLENSGSYLHQFVGIFGWLDTPLPRWHVGAYTLLLLVACMCHPNDRDRTKPLSVGDRAIAGVAALASIGLLCTLAYLWNVVGADRIGGIQGRYFIPIAPLLLLASGRFRPQFVFRQIELISVSIGLISGLFAISTLISRYYTTNI